MAALKINTGPIDATDELDAVARQDWRLLLDARRGFVRTRFPYDCRQLLRFVDEAERMCGPLGFSDVSDLIRHGLEIEPELVNWAVEGLRSLSPDEPVALDAAVTVGKARALAADPEVSPAPATGLNQHSAGFDDVKPNLGGGNSAEYLVRRLKRDAPEVAAELARGELPSARAAAIKAGIVKVRTRVERAFRLVERMNASERIDFARQIEPLIAAAEAE